MVMKSLIFYTAIENHNPLSFLIIVGRSFVLLIYNLSVFIDNATINDMVKIGGLYNNHVFK